MDVFNDVPKLILELSFISIADGEFRARLVPGTELYETIYDSLIRRDKERSSTRLKDNGFYNLEII